MYLLRDLVRLSSLRLSSAFGSPSLPKVGSTSALGSSMISTCSFTRPSKYEYSEVAATR